MNERYSLTAELSDLAGEFRVDRIEFPYYERNEYEPTGQIPVIRPVGRQRCLSGQRWGLMPYWGKSSVLADRESLGSKPYLSGMLAKKRCVIPCSGMLFERQEGKMRRVYRRTHVEKGVFGVAGIFDLWIDSEKNEFPMCTLLTTPSYEGESVPLVLEREAMDAWLNTAYDRVDTVRDLLRSIPQTEFRVELVYETKASRG